MLVMLSGYALWLFFLVIVSVLVKSHLAYGVGSRSNHVVVSAAPDELSFILNRVVKGKMEIYCRYSKP